MSDFYSILVLYLTDVQWLEKKKPAVHSNKRDLKPKCLAIDI